MGVGLTVWVVILITAMATHTPMRGTRTRRFVRHRRMFIRGLVRGRDRHRDRDRVHRLLNRRSRLRLWRLLRIGINTHTNINLRTNINTCTNINTRTNIRIMDMETDMGMDSTTMIITIGKNGGRGGGGGVRTRVRARAKTRM